MLLTDPSLRKFFDSTAQKNKRTHGSQVIPAI